MKDTAYTAEGLDAYTDTVYFTDPVGHQMFHLLSHTNGSGGKSLLVDGFRCASILCQEDPAAFLTLCKVSVPYHASGNEGISVRPRGNTSVFKSYATDLMGAPDIMRNVFCVRWNRYDRATYGSALSRRMILNSNENAAQIENWYRAARKWSEILKRPENEYWEQLKPGRPLSMSAFSSEKTSPPTLISQFLTTTASYTEDLLLQEIEGCVVDTVSSSSSDHLVFCSKPNLRQN